MSEDKPREYWLYKSISDDDTWTAIDCNGEDEDWYSFKGIWVVEHKAYDELRQKLDLAIKALEKYSHNQRNITVESNLSEDLDGDSHHSGNNENALLKEKLDIAVEALEKYVCARCAYNEPQYCYGYESCEALQKIKGENATSK